MSPIATETIIMTKLNDLEAILLSNAAKGCKGSLLPAPENVVGAGARLTRAIKALVKRGLAEELKTACANAVFRSEGEERYGVFITEAGYAAIGIAGAGQDGEQTDGEQQVSEQPNGAPAEQVNDTPKPPRSTKSATVIALLQRADGATLPELIAATGWLPHTTRAALTGLRKKGHMLDRSKRDGATCYRIVEAA